MARSRSWGSGCRPRACRWPARGRSLGHPGDARPQRDARGSHGVARDLRLGTCRCVRAHCRHDVRGADFRRHLLARGFTTILVAPSGAGKTTFVRSCYCLLGNFDRQPGCVATWTSTYTALEQAMHAYRDLPVSIDDFRETEGNARDAFCRLVLSIGDASGRARTTLGTSNTRTAWAVQPGGLLLVTGEQCVDDDAAIAGRVVEVPGEDIQIARLLQIQPSRRLLMPHVFAAFLGFVARLPDEYWAEKRAAMLDLRLKLGGTASRAGETLAPIATALNVVCDCFNMTLGRDSEVATRWREFVDRFHQGLPHLASEHAARIDDAQIDEVALTEMARGLQAGEIRLARLRSGRGPGPDARGRLVGAYDDEYLYLFPSIIARWVSDQLLRSARRTQAIGRKTLKAALERRVGRQLLRIQLRIEGRNGVWVWCVPRAGLSDAWAGVLDDPSLMTVR